MNISFIVLGITMFVGALLVRQWFAARRMANAGFMAVALAGIGNLHVGLFPENTLSSLHILGAALIFTLGNMGMLILGPALKTHIPRWLWLYTFLSGFVGLVALVLFMGHIYLSLGLGGMERFTAYPQTIWMMVFGTYLLARNSKLTRLSSPN